MVGPSWQGGLPPKNQLARAPAPYILSELDSPDAEGVRRAFGQGGREDQLMARSGAFRTKLAVESAYQVLYRSLMEALGYASNRKPLRGLGAGVLRGAAEARYRSWLRICATSTALARSYRSRARCRSDMASSVRPSSLWSVPRSL